MSCPLCAEGFREACPTHGKAPRPSWPSRPRFLGDMRPFVDALVRSQSTEPVPHIVALIQIAHTKAGVADADSNDAGHDAWLLVLQLARQLREAVAKAVDASNATQPEDK